jgi:hypothetical protein
MRHLIVGAGATLAQARALGTSEQLCPPLIHDFARKTWANYNPHPILEIYLTSIGFSDHGDDPRESFYELEDKGVTNIERFMEFAWQHRNDDITITNRPLPGLIWRLRIKEAGPDKVHVGGDTEMNFWDNLLYHGIGSPLMLHMINCFGINGEEGPFKSLELTKAVALKLETGDFVLNLNYDTTFEVALSQLKRSFVYSPNEPNDGDLIVCKPHGSLNMVSSNKSFAFGQPEWLGMPEPKGFKSYSGLIPPRLSKRYDQHWMAKAILASARNRRPTALTMWGIGLTESDQDLLALYARWAQSAGSIEVINPSIDVAKKAQTIFECETHHFPSVEDWLR